MITKSVLGLKCKWFQLKVVDAFTELNIPKFNCKFNSRSEWLVQLKRKSQLSFLFSPSLYLLSDDEFPVAGRGEPKQKQLSLTEPSPCNGLHLFVTTALGGSYPHHLLLWLRKNVGNKQDPTRVCVTPEQVISQEDISIWGTQRRKPTKKTHVYACVEGKLVSATWSLDIRSRKTSPPQILLS